LVLEVLRLPSPSSSRSRSPVVFVIDTSGSMTTEVTTGDLESDGYNMMVI
jgi:secreted protein with Ig-like and vWFA domain